MGTDETEIVGRLLGRSLRNFPQRSAMAILELRIKV